MQANLSCMKVRATIKNIVNMRNKFLNQKKNIFSLKFFIFVKWISNSISKQELMLIYWYQEINLLYGTFYIALCILVIPIEVAVSWSAVRSLLSLSAIPCQLNGSSQSQRGASKIYPREMIATHVYSLYCKWFQWL